MIGRLLIASPVLVLLASAQVSFAQCDLAETVNDCFDEVENKLSADGLVIAPEDVADAVDKLKRETVSEAEDLLRIFNTGVSSALSDGVESTFEDFLPKFRIFGAGGSLGDDTESLGIELNNILGLPIDDGYKISATLSRPAVFDPLLQSVDENVRAAIKTNLENQANDFDDLTIGFTYSPMTDRIGRSNHQLHSQLFESIYLSAESHAEGISDAAEQARDEVEEALQNAFDQSQSSVRQDWISNQSGFCGAELGKPGIVTLIENLDFEELTGDQLICVLLAENSARTANVSAAADAASTRAIDSTRTQIVENFMNGAANAFTEEYENLSALNRSLELQGFYRIADLINNQPQLNFAANYSDRDPIVGQDSFSIKIAYDFGFVNLNRFRKYNDLSCGLDFMYQCLAAYLDAQKLAHMERGDRFSVSLEYSRNQSYNYAIASGAGSLMLPSDESLIGSLAYGRYLTFAGEKNRGRSRVEFSASYEDVDSDTARQDRFMSSLTYSQVITDTAAISFGLVYANKPEYRGDVGTEVSAQLGINYKLFAPKEF